MSSFIGALVRKKPMGSATGTEEGELNRTLNLFDLTFLGIGSTLGLGVYVLAGTIARNTAGPAVILSFMLAAVAAVFSGLCYAEFGARVPKAGSAYVYSYVTVGELMAFVIGWNMILEYVIGTSSVARGYSQYMDSLPFINGTIQKTFQDLFPFNIPGTSGYFDMLAFAITLVMTVLLAIGVKESTRFNNLFTVVNLSVVTFVCIVGGIHINLDNWSLPATNTTAGGFFPYGPTGMLKGAGAAFYAFVGFDAIATTGEEVVNPQRNIPLGIVFSLVVVFIAYVSISSIATLVIPYYLLDASAPLPYLFYQIGMHWAGIIVGLGALFALSTSLMGSMFPLPRVMYAMGSDGLIFRWLAKVHRRFQTPFIATILSGVLAGAMAGVFNVEELTEMMSIGTLLAYALVAISVLVLRYDPKPTSAPMASMAALAGPRGDPSYLSIGDAASSECAKSTQDDASARLRHNASSTHLLGSLINVTNTRTPTPVSSRLASISICVIGVATAVVSALSIFYEKELFSGQVVPVTFAAISVAFILLSLLVLCRQPTIDASNLSFAVPLCPWIPIINLMVNIYLMMTLNVNTWKRFLYWMALGFLMYFGYGIRKSSLKAPALVTVDTRQMSSEDEDGGVSHPKVTENLPRIPRL